jgi:cellobiose phosphorylase
LIGSGDWNDGMNNVGRDGAGESVWLAFFLCHVIDEFAPIAVRRGDAVFAQKLNRHAASLRESIESQAWDGAWYRRAFYDDGTPLGSAANKECRIDSIAQSWSILSAAADPARAAQAMRSLDEQLVDERSGVMRLLTPPFNRVEKDPGYIAGYVPGVRENGGQYTHAAVWAIMAFARAGQVERAWQLLDFVNPLKHAIDRDAANIYKVEPYVAAADVLAIGQHAGRGGWTWYTGSAGWLYRLIVESLLGITREGDRLAFAPRLPQHWNGYRASYRTANTHFDIEILIEASSDKSVLTLDGDIREDLSVPIISDDARHVVKLVLGARSAT